MEERSAYLGIILWFSPLPQVLRPSPYNPRGRRTSLLINVLLLRILISI
jgi:hypothetical protein